MLFNKFYHFDYWIHTATENGNTWYSALPYSLTKLRLWQYLFFDSSVDFLWPLKSLQYMKWFEILYCGFLFCFKFEWTYKKILKYFLNWTHIFFFFSLWGLCWAFLLALHLYWLPRAAVANYTNWTAPNNRNLFSHSSGV